MSEAPQPPHDPSAPWARPVPMARPILLGPDVPFAPSSSAAAYDWPPLLPRWRALVDLLVLAGFIVAAIVSVAVFDVLPETADPRWQQVGFSGLIGIAALGSCILVLLVGRHRAASIGWTSRELPVNIALGLGALMLFYLICMTAAVSVTMLIPDLLTGPSTAQQAIEETFPPMSVAMILPLALFVAVWEEVAFRGLVLTRMFALLRRWWLAIPAASLLFGALHLYQGLLAVAFTTILGAIMSCLLVWRRSLVPAITLHWLHDVLIFVLLGWMSTSWK